MSDLISRQAVLEVIRKCHCEEWIKADIGAPIEALSLVTLMEKQEPCTDAISRQAAIYVINHAEVNFSVESEIDFTKHKREVHEIIENVLGAQEKALKELPPVNPTEKVGQWIPVSERLPEDKQSVLVWCPQYKNIYCAYLEKEQWWIFGAFVQIVPNGVVAWMPLPEPYKASLTGEEVEHEASD